jgi:hypothetical protein
MCSERGRGMIWRVAIRWLFVSLLCLVGVPAQPGWHSVLQVSVGTAAYIGPGNVVSGAIAWWGLRPYTLAYSGNVMDICDVATGATCGTVTAAAGVLTFPLIGGLSCDGGVACNISNLYDQSGQTKCNSNASPCDVVQATNSKRPTLSFASTGVTAGLPVAVCAVASQQVLITATNHATQA